MNVLDACVTHPHGTDELASHRWKGGCRCLIGMLAVVVCLRIACAAAEVYLQVNCMLAANAISGKYTVLDGSANTMSMLSKTDRCLRARAKAPSAGPCSGHGVPAMSASWWLCR